MFDLVVKGVSLIVIDALQVHYSGAILNNKNNLERMEEAIWAVIITPSQLTQYHNITVAQQVQNCGASTNITVAQQVQNHGASTSEL